MTDKLIFVYNADTGLFNTVTDIAHKILSPKTYACNLCALTHGHFKVRDSWVKYLQQSGREFEFLHRDEFAERYGEKDLQLPAIFKLDHEKPLLLFGPDKINSLKNIQQLIDLIENR